MKTDILTQIPDPKAPRRPLIRTALPGPMTAELKSRDASVLSTSLTRPYPLAIRSAQGAWVTDLDGNEFLDFTAGIAVAGTGHSHPRVVAAIKDQADRFLHMAAGDFYYDVSVVLAERLARVAPVGPGGARVFFCNSGAEAIEGAMKLARWATGRPNYLAFYGAFHGRTMGALSLTASKFVQRAGFAPLLGGVHHVPFPAAGDPVRTTDETFWRLDELFASVAPPDTFAAVFVEPIQGEGGYVIPPDDFLPRLREVTAAHGILLVLDEIQSGMGRTGRMFAAEHSDVEGDIVTVAKGIASGLPLGAIVARSEVMAWPPGSHGSSFGGNPVACAAALATMDLLEEGLVENAALMGDLLLDGLRVLRSKYPDVVAEARGRGLMAALEMRRPKLHDALVQGAFERGLLLLTAGRQAVRLSPPLIVSSDEVSVALEILDESLAGVSTCA